MDTQYPSQTVSIAIPTRYSRDSMVATIQSIRAQTRAPIIILADYSPPSKYLLQCMRRMNVKYHFIDGEHSHMQKVGLLLKKVETPYVIVASDDVLFGKDIVMATIRAFAHNPALTALGYSILPNPRSSTLVYRGLCWMIRVINSVSDTWNKSDNYLSLSGRGFALRTSHARGMRMPKEVINSDAFLYFENKQKQGVFEKIRTLEIYICPPSTLKEQLGPSSRYQLSKKELERYFGQSIAHKLRVPKKLLFQTSVRFALQYPIEAVVYLCIFVITRLYVWYGFDQEQKTNFWIRKD